MLENLKPIRWWCALTLLIVSGLDGDYTAFAITLIYWVNVD